MARTEQILVLFLVAVCATQAANRPSYDGGDGNKPDQVFNIDGGLATSDARVGVHSELPNKVKPVIGTVFPPNYSGNYVYPDNREPGLKADKVDNETGNKKENKSLLVPVYFPGENGQVIFPSGTASQNGKVPAYYIVIINGKATLVKNPAAGLSDSNDAINIASIQGQNGGIGGITIGGFSNLNGNWLPVGNGLSGVGIGVPMVKGSNYPNIADFKVGNGLPSDSVIVSGLFAKDNVPSFIPGEQPVNVQPVLTEHIQVPQPVYNIPTPVYPAGPYGYPNMPYPYPWPSMWDNMNSNMNWPNIIKFLINLGTRQQLPKPQPHHLGNSTKDNKSKTPGESKKSSVSANDKTTGGDHRQADKVIKNVDGKPNNKHPTNPAISGEKIEDEHNKAHHDSGSNNPSSNVRPKNPGKDEHKSKNNPNQSGSHYIKDQKPSTKNPIHVKPTERTTVKPTEATIIITKATEHPIWHDTKQPFETKNTGKHVTNLTPRTPIATKYTRPPLLTKTTVATIHVTNGTLHDEYTHSPNGSGKDNNLKHKTTRIPGLSQDKVPTNIDDNNSKKGNILNIPLTPGYNNDESKMTSGPYDPTLINLLNVVLKLPNKASYPTTKPSGDHESLKKLIESILKTNPGYKNHNLLPNQKPSGEDKILKELLDLLKSKPEDKEYKDLLELLKSKPGDKAIKDLLEILKSKPGDKVLKELYAILQQKAGGKGRPSHDKLSLFNGNGDKNEPNIAILGQLLLNLLNSYKTQSNLNVLVQEPGMKEETRSNLILLLNLLASNLGSEYGLGAGMDVTGIGGTGMGVTGIDGAGMGVAGLGGVGIGVPSLGSVGMGLGGYEPVNPANVHFLGQFPCDISNIRSGVGGSQGLERGLWQLLSQLYGYRGNHNSIRPERYAEENDDV